MKSSFNRPLVASIALSLTLLSACGGGGGDSTPAENAGDGTSNQAGDTLNGITDTNIGSNTANTGGIAKYAGNYLLDGCAQGSRLTDAINMTNNSFIQTTTLFTDDNCTQSEYQQIITYSLVYPGVTTATDLGAADHVNQKLVSWVVNGLDGSQYGSFPTDYQIMLLDGINLYMGEDSGDTPEERPTKLSSDSYVRQ